MTKQTQNLFIAAKSLPEAERKKLVKRLIDTLPEEQQNYFEEEWIAEVERRYEEVIKGRSKLVPWSKVRTRLREP